MNGVVWFASPELCQPFRLVRVYQALLRAAPIHRVPQRRRALYIRVRLIPGRHLALDIAQPMAAGPGIQDLRPIAARLAMALAVILAEHIPPVQAKPMIAAQMIKCCVAPGSKSVSLGACVDENFIVDIYKK